MAMDTEGPGAFHMAEAVEEDWEWIMPRYTEAAWDSMHPERRHATDITAVREQLERQVVEIRGPKGSANHAYVARDASGARKGFVWVMVSTSGFTGQSFGWVMCVYVEQDARGHGLGRCLMKKAEEWTTQQGVSRIILNVASGNEPARNLYESLEYEIESLRMIKGLTTQ